MKITLHSTSKIVELMPEGYVHGSKHTQPGPVKARVWEGQTEKGVPVHCFIVRIAPSIPIEELTLEERQEFDRDLAEHSAPTVTPKAYDMRLFL